MAASRGSDRTKARSGSIATRVHTGVPVHTRQPLGSPHTSEVGQQSSQGLLMGRGEELQVKRMHTHQHPGGRGAPLTHRNSLTPLLPCCTRARDLAVPSWSPLHLGSGLDM